MNIVKGYIDKCLYYQEIIVPKLFILIFPQGDEADYMYFVESGVVSIRVHNQVNTFYHLNKKKIFCLQLLPTIINQPLITDIC